MPIASHPQVMVALLFLALVGGAALLLRAFRVSDRMRRLSGPAQRRLLAGVWVGALSLITIAVLCAPAGGLGRYERATQIGVIVISWLIAFCAYTRPGIALSSRKLLPERASQFVIVGLLIAFMVALLLTAVRMGKSPIAVLVVGALGVTLVWQVLGDMLKARRRPTRRPRRNGKPRKPQPDP